VNNGVARVACSRCGLNIESWILNEAPVVAVNRVVAKWNKRVTADLLATLQGIADSAAHIGNNVTPSMIERVARKAIAKANP